MLFDKQPQQVTVEGDSVTISLFNIKESDILNILKSLGANKAHGHNDISIRMLKLSHKSTLKPLKFLFVNCLQTGIFPDQWKKANIVPIHKKGDKQRYLSISFLMIYLFKYFQENNLLSLHQSGFIPGDSCPTTYSHHS